MIPCSQQQGIGADSWVDVRIILRKWMVKARSQSSYNAEKGRRVIAFCGGTGTTPLCPPVGAQNRNRRMRY